MTKIIDFKKRQIEITEIITKFILINCYKRRRRNRINEVRLKENPKVIRAKFVKCSGDDGIRKIFNNSNINNRRACSS